ncbi:Protein ycf2 [Morus notabilis]|uniref:Protein ycf2 n=1 Tax=Morus notabilis TaxID=981085 RepID=W9RN29_9ROSA|nr:Protein ycf2 [Morus notabilis]
MEVNMLVTEPSSKRSKGNGLDVVASTFVAIKTGKLFFSWGKNPHESDFLRNISRENWIWLDNVWLENKDRFFSKVRNVSSNIQYDSTRSSFVQVTDFSQLKGSSDRSRDHFDSIRNEDSEYHTLITPGRRPSSPST